MSKRAPYQFSPEAASEGQSPKTYWRSLEAKENPESYQKLAESEFPEGVVDGASLLGRRSFLTLSGAAAAAAGFAGCIRRPEEKILPYSKAPEYVVPGVPLHFSSVVWHRGEALGVVVESHEGRPTKLEGNPDHPGSLGGLNMTAQASILDVYDADRSRTPAKGAVKKAGKSGFVRDAASWDDVEALLHDGAKLWTGDSGARLRFLSRPSGSPSFKRLKAAVLQRYPKAKFYTYSPVNEDNARSAARTAFGGAYVVRPRLDNAKVIVSLDSDFLQTESGSVVATKQFSKGRRVRAVTDEMNRLYVVEPSFSLTGSNADHRLPLALQDIPVYALQLAKALNAQGKLGLDSLFASMPDAHLSDVSDAWTTAVASDLLASKGKAIWMVGSRLPAWVHALGFAVNQALGEAGKTYDLQPVVDTDEGESLVDIQNLAREIKVGAVDTLFVLGGNPVLDAPADIAFEELLKSVNLSVHLASHLNETSLQTTWHVPEAHALESWGDAIGSGQTWSIQQPLIAPLYGAWSDLELLARIADTPEKKGHDIVRSTLSERLGYAMKDAFERAWRKGLHRGVVELPNVAQSPAPAVQLADVAQAIKKGQTTERKQLSKDALEVTFAPDTKLGDGAQANNVWLLELPDPMTKISWDNAALMSPKTAKALGLKQGDFIELKQGENVISVPVVPSPGQSEFSVALSLGWGRTASGRHANGVGFNVYPLRTSEHFHSVPNASVKKLGSVHKLVLTQNQDAMEGRPVAMDATLAEFKKQPNFPQHRAPTPSTPPLWKEYKYDGYKWGLNIDLSTCTGCNACVVACQSENNIATVGKDRIAQGRNMYWIRIDRYYVGDDVGAPEVAFQPVACQQCEEAPCENVCPVNATAHSPEGLNDMAYNRCIGTRYCMNNCPYKVRRFNYFNYHEEITETKKMQHNPNVTVRMRGVMEKCTYCVQRIQEAKIASKREKRKVRDGEITPACAQSCPADAVVFGDLNDPKSKVAAAAKAAQRYQLLAEIGTQPRTTYLGKVRNPNPALMSKTGASTDHKEAHHG